MTRRDFLSFERLRSSDKRASRPAANL